MTAFINGTDFAEYGVRVLAGSQHDALPETRDRTVTIPGRHGALDFGADLGARQFELKCGLIDAISPADLQRKMRALMADLTDGYGRPKTFRLSFSEEPEKYYEARLTGRVPVDRIHRLGFFSLPFTAFDPAAYASLTAYDPTESQTYDSGLVYNDYNADAVTMDSDTVTMDSALTFESGQPSGLYFPNTVTLDWMYTRHYTGAHNYSPYNTPLSIVIDGAVINPRITNQTNGQSMAIGVTLKAGEKLVVNVADYSVKRVVGGVETNLLTEYSGDFVELVSGDNSLVLEGGLPNATVTLDWSHKFI